jgi:hypothetical protein
MGQVREPYEYPTGGSCYRQRAIETRELDVRRRGKYNASCEECGKSGQKDLFTARWG